MKVIDIPVSDIVINPAIATRKGGHDPQQTETIAKSYQERHDLGLSPIQMKPGLVRADGNGKYELIDGLGRLDACKLVNESGGLDGEELMFSAVVARADDEGAIISGIQANFHEAVDIFDRADAMGKLQALGKSGKEIARIFNLSEGTVTQTLKVNDIPKKFIKAYRDGDLEQDALTAIADLEADDPKRTEIMEEAMRHRQKITDILAKKEFNDKKAEVAKAIEDAKARTEELKAQAKEVEKQAKELDKAMSKAEDKNELEKLRKEKAEIDKTKKTVGKSWAQAEKDLVKAKDLKEKLATQSPTSKKAKATAEDVKEVARNKGVTKKGGKKIESSPRSKNNLIVLLTGIVEDESGKFSEAAKTLSTHIMEYLNGDVTELQLSNKLKTCCKTDEQYK